MPDREPSILVEPSASTDGAREGDKTVDTSAQTELGEERARGATELDERTPGEGDEQAGASGDDSGGKPERARAASVPGDDEPTEIYEGSPKQRPSFDEAPTIVRDEDEIETKVAEARELARPDPMSSDEPASDPDWDNLPTRAAAPKSPAASARAQPSTFYAAGFWRRAAGALVDLAIVLPVSLVLGWLAGAVSGIHLPASRHHGIDFWLDLLLAGDHAFVGWLGLATVIGSIYLMVFQGTIGRTLGMRATKTRIIDPYGDPPSMARSALRTFGYLVSAATLGLGFVWVFIDAEKRGLHDWIAGTYVIRD